MAGKDDLVAHQQEQLEQQLKSDTRMIAEQTTKFLELVYPGYLVGGNIRAHTEPDGTGRLGGLHYFRLTRCTVENAEDLFQKVNAQMSKLFAALHAVDVTVGYGVVSYKGDTNLVLAVYNATDVSLIQSVVRGNLGSVEMTEFLPDFKSRPFSEMKYGILSGIPTLKLDNDKQTFSLSSIMRSLNGKDYTLLFFAKPISTAVVNQKIGELITVRDKCFALCKRNVSRSTGTTDTSSHSEAYNETTGRSETNEKSKSKTSGGLQIPAFGGTIGAIVGSMIAPGIGSTIGAGVGGLLDSVISNVVNGNSKTVSTGHSITESSSITSGYSDAISNAITSGESISGEIQNGFALELMQYANTAIERLKGGQTNGAWETAITFSSNSESARNVIEACLRGELSKPDTSRLPLLSFRDSSYGKTTEQLLLPRFLDESGKMNPLCSLLSSSEIGLLCTLPTDSVPDFELRTAKAMPMLKSKVEQDSVVVGNIADGSHELPNMPFAFSHADLNKHTLVCGITGSGKTTTVKQIIACAAKQISEDGAGIPFLVIESAKREYRHMACVDAKRVYTLGKPQLNSLRINPFYILPGVNPQTHIDYLKDLFHASFSFYGPMTYILEKCLHNIYTGKGWDLTLGLHPMLANMRSSIDRYDIQDIQRKYALISHKFLFPTMGELKSEIERYIRDEMAYEGEVAGNIKAAIEARLDSLCGDAKGFMFNTHEYLDMDALLSANAVIELEGLADDSDKAFCVGLMLIYISEYRQVRKEASGNSPLELKHLLVIEEAHRLLKNMETERTSENLGNPKGKAVEHFTNIVAEMRSYGQGVIIAEQIPTKLAPDVIKNTSNKIVHRLVSADDQLVVANAIGVAPQTAVQLGTLDTGYAYCHREGMALPVFVRVAKVDDDYVSDELIFNGTPRVGQDILSASALFDCEDAQRWAFRLLNTLLTEDVELCGQALETAKEEIHLLAVCRREASSHSAIELALVDLTTSLLAQGVFRLKTLPSDVTVNLLKEYIRFGMPGSLTALKQQFRALYEQDCAQFAIKAIRLAIRDARPKDTDAYIKNCFVNISDARLMELKCGLEGSYA